MAYRIVNEVDATAASAAGASAAGAVDVGSAKGSSLASGRVGSGKGGIADPAGASVDRKMDEDEERDAVFL